MERHPQFAIYIVIGRFNFITMSLVTFKDGKKEFKLGTVSMNWLEKRDVFDKFQEDHDQYSEIIFKTSKHNVIELSSEIIKAAKSDPMLRADIHDKLLEFAEFVKNSNGLVCTLS